MPQAMHSPVPVLPHVELPAIPTGGLRVPGGLRNLVHPVVIALLCSNVLNLKMYDSKPVAGTNGSTISGYR